MIQKPFHLISKADIDALVANVVSEIKSLEYKGCLPGTTDREKKEFLADVSSFGNASGGDIIYGITEAIDACGKRTGDPDAVQPLVGITPDEAKLRLESLIRDGIRPRLPVQVRTISGWEDDGRGYILLVRVLRSFASPHIVTFKGTSRFFSRNSAGKYQLDVDEIRAAFLATESQADRIKRFREDRLGNVVADETPILLSESPFRLVLHLIPIASFLNNERLDLTNEGFLLNGFRPILGTKLDFRRNLDGFLTWIPGRDQAYGFSYCQLFSHGAVEAVGTGHVLGGKTDDGRNVIAADYEADVVAAVEGYVESYKHIGIAPPVAIALALVGCKGALLQPEGWRRDRQPQFIDRDAVILPEVVIESLDVDVPQIMKPIFDMVWNACGFPCSLNYDKDGGWRLKRR